MRETQGQRVEPYSTTRTRLLAEARGGCCVHRLTWLRVVGADNNALKHEPLHAHHVVFPSVGGSGHPDNLVPLCPTCHSMLHGARRTGVDFLPDNQLKECWYFWKGLRVVVPAYQNLSDGPSAIRVRMLLQIYALEVEFGVPATMPYGQARADLLQRTLGVLKDADRHFPFARGIVHPTQWHLSSDVNAIAGQWLSQPAIEVFSQSSQLLRAEAPVLFALSESSDWVFSTRPQHRGL